MVNCHLKMENGGKHVCVDMSAGCSWRIDTCGNMNLFICKFIAFSHLYFSFQNLGFFNYMIHFIKT